ncbi:MAG: Sec-independent protein translocase protein TatB [Hyphomonadaceae bacterium]|nr:Sec-independent protein translocase protein TatB [Hyphomonadaceae bacterium]
MLPGVGFSEILVIGVIALLVVGPKDLPLMLRKFGQFMARLRAMANEFRAGFDELARQAELDELKKEVEALRRGAVMNDPVFTDIETKMTEAVTPPALAPPQQPAPDAPATPTPPSVAEPEAAPAPDLPEPVKASR